MLRWSGTVSQSINIDSSVTKVNQNSYCNKIFVFLCNCSTTQEIYILGCLCLFPSFIPKQYQKSEYLSCMLLSMKTSECFPWHQDAYLYFCLFLQPGYSSYAYIVFFSHVFQLSGVLLILSLAVCQYGYVK